VLGDQPEGERQQAIPRQDGDRLAVDLVVGGMPAAEVVVVHGRQVVVDERVGVDALQRAGGRQHVRQATAHGLRARDHQDGA
jgi:hypothetical protein